MTLPRRPGAPIPASGPDAPPGTKEIVRARPPTHCFCLPKLVPLSVALSLEPLECLGGHAART